MPTTAVISICNDPDIQDVSVSSKSATFSINSNDRLSPDTNYIASISSSIQDQNGNFLDCFASRGVDDNCEWNFSTSGSTANPTISINPTSGPVVTSVTVTGNGFDPISTVAITFDGSTEYSDTYSSGGFTATFMYLYLIDWRSDLKPLKDLIQLQKRLQLRLSEPYFT